MVNLPDHWLRVDALAGSRVVNWGSVGEGNSVDRFGQALLGWDNVVVLGWVATTRERCAGRDWCGMECTGVLLVWFKKVGDWAERCVGVMGTNGGLWGWGIGKCADWLYVDCTGFWAAMSLLNIPSILVRSCCWDSRIELTIWLKLSALFFSKSPKICANDAVDLSPFLLRVTDDELAPAEGGRLTDVGVSVLSAVASETSKNRNNQYSD